MHMEEIAALQAEAASRLADGPYYVIGTSMGGVAAIHLAAENPDRVQGIVLEGGMAPALVTDLWARAPAAAGGRAWRRTGGGRAGRVPAAAAEPEQAVGHGGFHRHPDG